jgi:thiol-disulfide isomerase/thioredoxin
MRKLLIILLILIIITPALALSVGDKAPFIPVREHISGPDVSDAEILVLKFWATWCGPCKRDIEPLSNLSRQGLRVMGIAVDKDADAVREYVVIHKVRYSIYIDNGAADWYEVRGYPTLIIIDQDSKIAWIGNFYGPEFIEALNNCLRR